MNQTLLSRNKLKTNKAPTFLHKNIIGFQMQLKI